MAKKRIAQSILAVAAMCAVSSLMPCPLNAQSQIARKEWPPRDQFGHIICGPKKFGTAEDMGWPRYGWTEADHARYLAGGHVKITSRAGNVVSGVIEN